MKLAKRDIKRRLTKDEAEAELTRFTYYSSERHSRLDGRAKEAWELGHNSRDNTGTQYTQEQVRMMEQVGAPVVSVNYIYPILAQEKAILTNDRPMGKVVPAGGDGDKTKAYTWEKILNAMWRASYGDAHYRQTVKDSLFCYWGGMIVEPTSFYRRGKFRLTYQNVPWNEIYLDPSAKMSGLSFQDAEAMYIAKFIPKRKCQNIYGFAPDDNGEFLHSDLWDMTEEEDNRRVLIRDIYTKEYGIYGLMTVPDPVNETTFVTRKVFASEQEMDAFRAKHGAQLTDYVEDIFVRRLHVLGYDHVTEDVLLPLTVYPLVIYTPDDYNNPFGRSPAEYLREPQKALNKFVQTTILNAMLSSNVRFLGPRGAFPDKDAWTKNAAVAGGTVEYTPDPSLPDGGKPEQIKPLPLASAWYQLADMMKYAMEYMSGFPPFLQGDPTQTPNTATGAAAVSNAGGLRPKDIKLRYETVTTFLWKASMEYISYYADRAEIVRYLDDFNRLQEIPLNTILDDRSIQLHDVNVAAKVSLPSDRMEMRESVKLAMQQTADPNWQKLMFEELMNLQDSPVNDELRQRIDVNSQLSQQLQQMMEENKDLQALVDRLSTEVIVGEKKVAIEKFKGDLNTLKAETKAKAQVALAKVEGQQGESLNQDTENDIQEL